METDKIKVKPSLAERALAVVSPAAALQRTKNRAEFAAAQQTGIEADCCYGHKPTSKPKTAKKENKNTKKEAKEKQNLRFRVEEALKKSPVLKGILRSIQTYVAPIGYEPSTDNVQDADNIRQFLADWDCNTDIKGMRAFFGGILSLIEVEKTRGGDTVIATPTPQETSETLNAQYLLVQPMSGCRIGNPGECTKEEDYYPPDFPEEKRNTKRYRNGLEFSDFGRLETIHIWRLESTDKAFDAFAIPSEEGEVWVYDQAYSHGTQIHYLTDSLYVSEDKGTSDFEQCLDQILSVVRTLRNAADRLEFATKLAGFLKGGDGNIDSGLPGANQNFECGSCDGEGCEQCERPKLIEVGDFLEIWGIPEGRDFDPSTFDLNSDMLVGLINALLESAAFCVNLPATFINVRAARAQGTVERSDLQKAQKEFVRRRRPLEKMVARPIITKALLHGKANGSALLAGISEEDLIKGEFIYPADISVDPGRDGTQLLRERNAGLIPDSLIHSRLERAPQRMRKLMGQQVQQHIEDVREYTGDPNWSPDPERISQMLFPS